MKTTKTIILLIVFSIMVFFRVQAQNPGFEWAVQMGGDSAIVANSLTVDFGGSQIITGTFNGTADFDPGEGIFNLTSSGREDIFIQKLSPAGSLIWAARMGDVNSDAGRDVITDASGNIYMTGYFDGTIDADPGTGTFFLSQTKTTAFIIKLSPDGNLMWAKQMGFPGDNGLVWGYSIALDNNQNVLTTGHFVGGVDFDPGSGTYSLSSGGGYCAYIQKLDASGNFIWARQISGSAAQYGRSVATDASGNVYTSGYFFGTCDFNPDKKLKYMMTAIGGSDSYFQKLDVNGNFVWAKQIGGTASEYCYEICINSAGLFTTGYFYNTVDFNPGSGTFNLTSQGLQDMFILKLDLGGNFSWVKQVGGSGYNCGCSIKTDASGNIYTTGYTYLTCDFNPDPANSFYITAVNHDDSFISKSDANGNFLWVTQAGSQDWEYGFALALDASGNIFTAGNFGYTVDFNPGGNGVFELTNSGKPDVYVQKLNPSGGDNCPIPVGLSAANITEATADLGWNAVTGASGYFVRYREINTDWIEVADMITGTSLSVSGLTAAIAYEFQVKTNCYSNYSYSGEFMTTGAGCIDIYEPNATLATAGIIAVNTDISALIGTNVDSDWFKFSTTTAAKNIKITLTNLPADYNIKLYKADGTLIGSSSNTGTTSETIIYNYNKAGTYYILVNGYSGAYDPISCYILRAAVSSTAYKSADAGINTSELTESLKVYPNPSNSTFNFMLETESNELVTIQLFDLSGRQVQEYNSLSPDNVITIGEDLKPGMYMAVVTQGNYRKAVKLTKVR